MASPKVSEEFIRFWLHRFRKPDVQQQNHRQMLIDSFINTIYLYDDKIVITFNYKEGTKTVTFDDMKASLAEGKSSDLDSCGVPAKTVQVERLGRFLFVYVTLKIPVFSIISSSYTSRTHPKRHNLGIFLMICEKEKPGSLPGFILYSAFIR